MLRSLLFVIAATVSLSGSLPVEAAPGGPGGGDRAQTKHRAESEVRKQPRKGAADAGERRRAPTEEAERFRDEAAQNRTDGQGNATSAEMQARREERKRIQETHRTMEGDTTSTAPKKKPWWKFWDDDPS